MFTGTGRNLWKSREKTLNAKHNAPIRNSLGPAYLCHVAFAKSRSPSGACLRAAAGPSGRWVRRHECNCKCFFSDKMGPYLPTESAESRALRLTSNTVIGFQDCQSSFDSTLALAKRTETYH
ncbi:hypothetical protein THAOC_10404 [Thalassiosira oceanica]|uniref:Uncharacterized protein n=1 Tax=Thalassiosira oceanica TaxID=159749 RepID=K0SQ38_THAOC|nr:hypothetical protein THAOC_10404 [Thalassiosira oceanica]|eukprot:EJK68423.1 hypothetical protein THAOC_10404 [Thalassiosira oceanica]